MLSLEKIQKDINELQTIFINKIDPLKKRYFVAKKQEVNPNRSLNHQLNTLDILKESGLIGCMSAEPDLSNHYKWEKVGFFLLIIETLIPVDGQIKSLVKTYFSGFSKVF